MSMRMHSPESRAAAKRTMDQKTANRLEDIDFMRDTGEPDERIARRLGINVRSLRRFEERNRTTT